MWVGSLIWIFGLLLLLAIMSLGITLIFRGARGRVDLAAPHCGKCDYDLRWVNAQEQKACPECGNDLAGPRAVHFGRFGRSVPIVLLGVLFLLTPVMIIAASVIAVSIANTRAMQAAAGAPGAPGAPGFGMGPGGVAGRTNAELIADLAATAGQPWTWDELSDRYVMGALSDAEAAAALDQLIAYLNAQPGDQRSPMWAKSFLEAVLGGGGISDEQRTRLIAAYYSGDMQIHLRSRVRSGGQVSFMVIPVFWDLPGLSSLVSLREVTVSGEGSVQVLDNRYREGRLSGGRHTPMSGFMTVTAEPGAQTLTLVFDMGVMEAPEGFGGRQVMSSVREPGPPSEWPPTLHTWTQRVEWPLEVLPEDVPSVKVIEPDATTAAALRRGIAVRALQISPDQRSRARPTVRAEVDMSYGTSPPVPVHFSVIVRYGETEHEMGFFNALPDGSSTRSQPARNLTDFPEAVEHVDVILRADVAGAERTHNMESIWGGELIFEKVPVIRRGGAP